MTQQLHASMAHERPAPELRDRRPRRRKLKDWFWARRYIALPVPNVPLEEPQGDLTGICCSGGGVRSAAYNLGALQALREEGVLGDTEYVSAVSGGSYIAAAHAALSACSPPKEGEKPVYGPASPEEQHFRNHSSYLAPGLGGKARLLLVAILGMMMNLVLIGIAVVLVARPLGWLAGVTYPQLGDATSSGALQLEIWMWAIPAGAVALGILAAVPDLLVRIKRDERRHFLAAWSARLIGSGILLALFLIAVPQLLLLAREVGHSGNELGGPLDVSTQSGQSAPADKATGLFQLINLGAIVTAGLGALRAFVARKRSFFVLAAAAVAGPLVVIAPALWVLNEGAVIGTTETELVAVASIAAFGIMMWLIADLMQWSLHPFYRRRLSSAFFVRRKESVEGPTAGERGVEEIPYTEPLRLSTLTYAARDFPKLVVCAAANVSDEGVTPPGRWATPFTFSQEEIGGPLIGALPTPVFEQAAEAEARSVTLPAAVAMSGAAVSPVMGKKTIRAMSFLLGLTNVRLGVWVPNPRWVKDLPKSRFAVAARVLEPAGKAARSLMPERVERSGPARALRRAKTWLTRTRPTPWYLFKELFGLTSVDDRFLYVTDGGHYDNLGLIELLRRGCTTIFCLDAGGDPSGTYPALGEAVALARSELQVDIEVDPDPIKPDKETRLSKHDFVSGRFRFRATRERHAAGSVVEDEDTKWVGELVYCRAAVTEDAPWDVRAFHDRDKRFPYHSTFDQLFNDEKFESYRALGAHTVRRAAIDWRRRVALDKTHEVLREVARGRTTITSSDLVDRVRSELVAARLPAMRPLLDEISKAEQAAQRPRLELVVQEHGELVEDVLIALTAVWEYWEVSPAEGDDWRRPSAPVAATETDEASESERWYVRIFPFGWF